MSSPARHPVTGQFTAAATGLPTGDLVNSELTASYGDPDDAAAAVPDVPDHVTALNTGAMSVIMPPDDASEDASGGEQGLP